MAPSAVEEPAPTSFSPKSIESRLFINGEFVDAISGKKFDIQNPSTKKFSASVAEAGVEDVDAAVKAAKAAYPSWSELNADARGDYIYKMADYLENRVDEMAHLDAICMGRPAINDMISSMTIKAMRYYAGKAQDVSGDSSLNTAGMVNITFRQPFGVVGGIIPWNVPAMMFVNKAVVALICGNTMVLKTSEKAPLSCLLFGQAAQAVGLPKGVLNILSGFGRPCGEAIAKHMEIRKVSFTGSTATGRAIKKAAAESNLKNVTLELGGKSPLIIFDDADIQKAVPVAAFSVLYLSGQMCIASSRVYVHEKITDQFIDALKAAFTQMGKSGDPLVQGTMRGPQADKLQYDRVMAFLDVAKKDKISTALGGNNESDKDGYYIEPTIYTNVPEDSRLMKEEIFGPVVCVNTFTDEDEVVARANDTEYGLYASVFTKDISRALRVAKKFESGSVGVNCTSPSSAFDMPFGGYKASGDGREFSKYAFDYWTELKSVYIAL